MEILKVHPDDNVLVALRDLPPGTDVVCEGDVLAEAFRKELGYAQPDVYRQQVAELVGRHREGADADALREPVGGCGCTDQDARTLCALPAGYIHNHLALVG